VQCDVTSFDLCVVADSVKWSPDGSMFVVVFDSALDIYSTEVNFIFLWLVYSCEA